MTTYESEIEIIEGTVGKDVNLQCQDKDNNAVDITGCDTLEWRVFEAEATKLRLKGTCTEVDLTTGKIKYPLVAADWASNRLGQGRKDYKSVIHVENSVTDYKEDFEGLLVHVKAQSPDTLES